jgi:hypothetical protein
MKTRAAFEEAAAATFEEAVGTDLLDLACSPDVGTPPSTASSFKA